MAVIPSGYLKAVVSLGALEAEERFSHRGTGFLYFHPLCTDNDGTTRYHPFLITNWHVADHSDTDHIRFNRPADGSPKIYSIQSVTTDTWVKHPRGADVAVKPVLFPGPLMVGRNITEAEIFVGGIATPSDEDVRQIVEGNAVFVLGFPLGLVGKTRNYPIVRHGIIARIQDWARGDENTFLIDSSIFPGNSGGPVVLKPESIAIKGTNKITHSLLIGAISSYIPSRDVAISSQNGKPRIIFEENSGLSEVVPIDIIKETLDFAISTKSRGKVY